MPGGGGKFSPAGSVVRYRLPPASTAPALRDRTVFTEGIAIPGGAPRSARPTRLPTQAAGIPAKKAKGHAPFSGSGARGTAGRREGAAGQ